MPITPRDVKIFYYLQIHHNTHHAVLSSKMNQYLQFPGALIVNIYELGCKMSLNLEKALIQVQYAALN